MQLLRELKIPIPVREFDFDDSEEGKAARTKKMIQDYVDQGMPEQVDQRKRKKKHEAFQPTALIVNGQHFFLGDGSFSFFSFFFFFFCFVL